MNLDEAVRRNKYTMSVHAVGIAWSMGATFTSQGFDKLVTPDRIISTICNLTGLGRSDLLGKCRLAKIVKPRQIAMMLIRDTCPSMSLPKIGKLFNMDHTSSMHGVKAARRTVAEANDNRKLYREACLLLGVEPRP